MEIGNEDLEFGESNTTIFAACAGVNACSRQARDAMAHWLQCPRAEARAIRALQGQFSQLSEGSRAEPSGARGDNGRGCDPRR